MNIVFVVVSHFPFSETEKNIGSICYVASIGTSVESSYLCYGVSVCRCHERLNPTEAKIIEKTNVM